MAAKKKISLADVPKAEVYKLPSAEYFEQAEGFLMDISKSKLPQIQATNIYVVPDEFFAKQREQIFAQTTKKRMSIWPSSRSMMSMAAGVALLGIMLWMSLPKWQRASESSEIEALSQQEIATYMASQNITIEDLSNVDFKTTLLDTMAVDQLNINNRDIESYLIESNENFDL